MTHSADQVEILRRLRRARRIALLVGGLLAMLIVLGLRRCSGPGPKDVNEPRERADRSPPR